MPLPRGFNPPRSNILHIRLLFVLHNLAIVWAPVLQCMILSERPSTRLPRLAFEGEQVTPTQGEDYATQGPFAPVCLCSRSRCDSAFSADRFPDAISISTKHDFNRRN